jgi:hypothetical protein
MSRVFGSVSGGQQLAVILKHLAAGCIGQMMEI